MRIIFLVSIAGSLFAGEYEDRFEKIYKEKLWGINNAGEGFSGGGSLLDHALPYYEYLTNFLRENSITSVVDLGCGDWEFSRHVDWTGIDYKGFDVVPSVIEKDIQKYGSDHIHFYRGNFLEMEIPRADLMICKHVLQHMPNRDVFLFLKLLSKFKHCLILDAVPSRNGENIDYSVGKNFPYWEDRGTDLTQPPFNIKGKKELFYKNEMVIHVDNTREVQND